MSLLYGVQGGMPDFISREEEEYVQLHLDVRFQPDDKCRLLSGAVWSDGSNEDFFKFVRESGAYRAVKGDRVATVSVYLDET